MALKDRGFNVVCGDVPPIPTESKAQVVWLSHVLEHLSSFNKVKNFLVECSNKLEDKGYIIIISPDIFSWKDNFYDADWSHSYPTSLRRVVQALRETGFSIQYKSTHTATITNPILSSIATFVFSLIPIRTLDYFINKLINRDLLHPFYTAYGWRQIYIVGQKKGSVLG